MIDYHKTLVDSLKNILPTYYEMTLTSKTKTPCISYMELDNAVSVNGDTLGYSRLQYQVKVWGNNLAELQRYALEIDASLRAIGFTRISSGEMYDNNSSMIQKILTYEALVLEQFKED